MHTALRSRDFLAGVAGLLVVVCCLKTPAADPLPAGALDPTFLPARPDGLVRDVAALPDGKVLIAGDFTKVGDLPRPAIARLCYDGSADEAFDPGSGPTGALGSTPARINTILHQSDGRILIGGVFTNFQGRARGCIARLWPNGALEEDELAGGGATNEVLALALQADGRILVGGKFTRFHGVHCAQLVRLLPDGRLDPTFQYRYQDASKRGISAIAVQSDGRIVIGGSFRYLASQYRPSIARLHAPVPLLSLQLQAKIAEAQFHLECCATIGSRLQLQRSSNMLDWDPWTNLLAIGSLQIIPDPDFSSSSCRFFRVLQEPGDSINP
ncbi:MAG: delta-60 repeat domain-containing protein [Verrucomicrobia bacterium]|nr:delta-60 repeat domain-containing protein [Verrucomicrobiota bacterium]